LDNIFNYQNTIYEKPSHSEIVLKNHTVEENVNTLLNYIKKRK